jgi:predicted nucleotidyltransferase
MSIDIRPHDLAEVRTILATHLPPDARIWVFGSRANGRSRRGSDLDLAVDAGRKLTVAETHALIFAFEDSNLPYTVDVVDLHAVTDTFRTNLQRGPLLPLGEATASSVA